MPAGYRLGAWYRTNLQLFRRPSPTQLHGIPPCKVPRIEGGHAERGEATLQLTTITNFELQDE